MQIGVIGAGSWGTALAIIAARAGHEVSLWSRNDAVVESINRDHVNPAYLRGAIIPSSVCAMRHMGAVVAAKPLIILAAPSHAARQVLGMAGPELDQDSILVSATKGIEIETGNRISEIVAQVIPTPTKFVCFSGPSFAKEVVNSHPTAVVASSHDQQAATTVQSALSFENLRVYTNDDVVGTEIAGSLKNVMAIAAGMVSGLGFGSNTIAALITRGLAEVTRLALRQGAKMETMLGLAGVGDLVLTCTGSLSRNRFVGQELGRGRTLAEIQSEMSEVAEGVKTTLAVRRWAADVGVQMPITDEVHAVLYERKSVRDAVSTLIARPLRTESNW